MENDPNTGGFASLIEKIRKWSAPFIGVALFIFSLRIVAKEVQENIAFAVGAVVSVGWLFLFWIYISKVERQVGDGIDQQPKIEKVPQYPKWRRWSLFGMILLPILTLSGFIIADYIERRPSNKTIILIANFDGPSQKYAVTQTIINRMRRATAQFPEVAVNPLGEVIKEGTDIEEVRKIGAKHKASIVVWGFYDEALNGTVHIDQVRRTSGLSLVGNEMDFDTRLSEGRGISVQEALSGDMSLLALLIIGVARYDVGDLDGAIERFTKALEQLHSPQSENIAIDIKFFLGKALGGNGKYNEALDRLQEVASIRSNDTDVLDWLGITLHRVARYSEAEQALKRALEIKEKTFGKDHLETSVTLQVPRSTT
jgi:Tetratricopeptide repeat